MMTFGSEEDGFFPHNGLYGSRPADDCPLGDAYCILGENISVYSRIPPNNNVSLRKDAAADDHIFFQLQLAVGLNAARATRSAADLDIIKENDVIA